MKPPLNMIDLALNAAVSAYASSWDVIIEDPETSASAKITEAGGYTILAFKGSQEIVDWKVNFTALPWRYGGAWVHAGFKTAHKSVWSEVRNELVRRINKPLIVTGHSLGGALAELSCLSLSDFPNDVHLITFGKPNVFLRPLKARFPFLKTQISVVSGSDLVARLPRYCYGPDEGQQMLYLARNGDSCLIPDDKSTSVPREPFNYLSCASDHFTALYRKRLDQLIQKSTQRLQS
jgi:hypothetical protein